MKDFKRKLIVTICAVSASVTMLTTVVSATEGFRSGPGVSSTETTTTVAPENNEASKEEVQTDATSVTSQASAQNVPAKKYLTKWGGFFWFLLSVIVNFVLSCWVGNRFYRLARRSAQSSAEIRALRKDIEEKFASTIKDINEPLVEVVNNNESYAQKEEGMEMPERKAKVEIDDEEREILGRWDMQYSASKAASEQTQADEPSRRAYAPTRAMSGIEFEDDEPEEEEKNESASPIRTKIDGIAKAGNKAGNKAKDFLSNIFPFDE